MDIQAQLPDSDVERVYECVLMTIHPELNDDIFLNTLGQCGTFKSFFLYDLKIIECNYALGKSSN